MNHEAVNRKVTTPSVVPIRGDSTDFFAAIVALITHPVVIGSLELFLVIFYTLSSPDQRWFYFWLVMLLTFAPAALYLLVFFRGNVIEMLEMINREARLVPYILMIIGAIIAVILMVKLDAPQPVFLMTLVLLANEVVLATVNFWTKVSIHTATATFGALTLGYLISPAWYGLLALVPLIGWARVYRKRHTFKQVVGGSAIAAAVTATVLLLSQRFIS